MFFNKKKNYKPYKPTKDHFRNRDGYDFIRNDEWSTPETDEKIKFIFECYDKKIPVRDFAYLTLSLEAMKTIVYYGYTNRVGNSPVYDFDIYKVVHSHIPEDIEKLKYTLIALSYGVRFIDNIEHLFDYDVSIYKVLAESAKEGADLCHRVHPGVTPREIVGS